MAQKFYAVKVGKTPGIYRTWDQCKAQVHHFPGAIYKSFPTMEEAEGFMGGVNAAKTTGAAAAEAEENIEAKDGVMVAYVDGSFHAAKQTYSFGAIIFYENKEYRFSQAEQVADMVPMRNVAGEIRGSERAMDFALEQGAKEVHIYHDYEGIARWCTGDWKANKAGTQRYRDHYLEVVKSGLKVVFHKVKGHSGVEYNEVADQLAKAALGIS